MEEKTFSSQGYQSGKQVFQRFFTWDSALGDVNMRLEKCWATYSDLRPDDAMRRILDKTPPEVISNLNFPLTSVSTVLKNTTRPAFTENIVIKPCIFSQNQSYILKICE